VTAQEDVRPGLYEGTSTRPHGIHFHRTTPTWWSDDLNTVRPASRTKDTPLHRVRSRIPDSSFSQHRAGTFLTDQLQETQPGSTELTVGVRGRAGFDSVRSRDEDPWGRHTNDR